MKKRLIGLLAAAGLALTGCGSASSLKVKIFCYKSDYKANYYKPCLHCEDIKTMTLDDYNIVSLECTDISDGHYHYILTYRE